MSSVGLAKEDFRDRRSKLWMAGQSLGLVAQLAERPVVCGRVEGATPFGSVPSIASARRRAPVHPAQCYGWQAIFGERSSVFRAPLPGGVKVARRPVKPFVLVRVQVWQPILRVRCKRSAQKDSALTRKNLLLPMIGKVAWVPRIGHGLVLVAVCQPCDTVTDSSTVYR